MSKPGRDMSAVLRASEDLISHIDRSGLPQIHRGLAQLDALSRRLAQGPPDSHTEAKAYVQRVGLPWEGRGRPGSAQGRARCGPWLASTLSLSFAGLRSLFIREFILVRILNDFSFACKKNYTF